MSTGNPLEQLRRRMQSHATPTAFAALAEEHRRAGRFAEAIAVCRDGLERYPAYASARVTLGRALLDSGDAWTAAAELEQAVAQSPDNLAAAKALDAAHLACAALPPPVPVVTLDDLESRIADDDTSSIPVDLIAQALGAGADGPQEFGLAPDWSIPALPDVPMAEAGVGPGLDATDTLALYPHAESPTIGFTPPHLQGEEPAGIWPVPSSMTDPVDDAPTDGARVYSWAIRPPNDINPAADPRPAADQTPPVSVWEAPTIDAPLMDLAALAAMPVADLDAEPLPDDDALARFGSELGQESAVAPVQPPGPEPDRAQGRTAVSASAALPEVGPAGIDESSPFWGGLFGGEAGEGTPAPFAGWGPAALPPTDGADRSPWAEEGTSEQPGAWNVPDGPSATWALGDLHEAAGADVTPFRDVPDEGPAVPTPFASVTVPPPPRPTEPVLAEPVLAEPVLAEPIRNESIVAEPVLAEAVPVAVAWAGSVKSALGEVFALAAQVDSLEPPTHRSPAMRRIMADAALEATLEDVAMRDDTIPPALASLQQMLDAVRARRAALFSHPEA